MNLLTNLDKLKEKFPQHNKCQIRTLLIILGCILELRTVCLYKCKDKVGKVTGKKNNRSQSNYKRLLRFYAMKKINAFCNSIFMLLLSLVEISGEHLVLDRTNWKVGKKNINILTLGILYKDCFIPLCWQQMNKRGNSNFGERETLMNRFIKLWNKAGKSIQDMVLVADREFIGPDWFNYLSKSHLSFVFRLKANMYFELVKGGTGNKRQLKSYHKLIEKHGVYTINVMVQGVRYSIVMTKNLKQDRKEPYIYFISNMKNANEVLSSYMKRWKIECCFRHLKSNGFNVEAMNLKNNGKIQLMIGVVIIAYVLAIREGILKHCKNPIPVKKYANGKIYLSVSLFRTGLEILDQLISTVKNIIKYLVNILQSVCHERGVVKKLLLINIKNVQ